SVRVKAPETMISRIFRDIHPSCCVSLVSDQIASGLTALGDAAGTLTRTGAIMATQDQKSTSTNPAEKELTETTAGVPASRVDRSPVSSHSRNSADVDAAGATAIAE